MYKNKQVKLNKRQIDANANIKNVLVLLLIMTLYAELQFFALRDLAPDTNKLLPKRVVSQGLTFSAHCKPSQPSSIVKVFRLWFC